MKDQAGNGADTRIREKRKVFYEAAEPLFERFGLRKTTVEEICRAAGASKRTFYEVFRDKGDLFVRMIFHIGSRLDRTPPDEPTAASAGERLDRLIDSYVELARSKPFFRVFFEEPGLLQRFPEVAADWVRHMERSVLRDTIEEGVRAGEFRPVDPLRGTILVYTVLDNMLFLAPPMLGIEDPLNDEEWIAMVRSFIQNGLRVKRYEER